ncbi:hypothetical protein [Actinacidiphila acidipaludis]|uniref:Peptidoglycan binding domain-containing protein n=1 Tax=Actinacidiphila acidipaludis TaxID=2873382 RepID=A0ABS7Q4V4_9ACTN|nr:hypothetical protein [Streptomyces acidipaludis]MBY8877052.1 hypothetical protein [Streptomyces acidipaludis]
MSRETDSSSSGPQGRGGAAYPSGTPPYGARPFPSLHPQERPRPTGTPDPADGQDAAGPDGTGATGADQPAGDGPKTETTLTTRIRINIPGSRPIPPVVVRTPVEEGTQVPESGTAGPGGASGGPGGTAGADEQAAAPAEAPAEPEAEPEKPASDWFAPRKPVSAQPPAAEPGPSFGDAPQAPPAASSPAPGDSSGGFALPDDFFRPADPAPFPESDTGSGPRPFPPGPGQGPGLFPESDTGSGPRPFPPGPGPVPGAFGDPDTGSMPNPYLPPPVGSGSTAGPGARAPHDSPAGGIPAPFGTEDFPPGVPRPVDPLAGQDRPVDASGAFAPPAGPTTGPATGSMQVPPFAPNGTGGAAVPNGPAGPAGFRPPVPGAGGPGRPGVPGGPGVPPADRVSGDTLVSGIPAVPPGEVRGPRSGPGEGAAPAPVPAPAPERVPASSGRKGRSKVVLAGVAVGAVVVLAYGAGLLMNHAEVPRGTTVLGVSIGNMTKDDAVQTLDKALGNRTTAPLTLTIGGKKQSLKPSVAGLSLDTDATVRSVAHTDYNPVSVIGSLFGGSRTADPVIRVDNDKLKAALQGIAGRNSSGSDGMVRFADHKAIAVPGKPSTSFDVNAAATQVAAAYRNRAATGADQPIPLTVTTVPPKVTQAELNRAVDGFGKTAMAGQVTVRADAAHKLPFNNSLPTFLTMVPDAQGKLVPHIDLTVLKSKYGHTFDGVLLRRSDGSKTAVTPQDVATALIQALGSSSPAGRVVTLPHVAG